MAQEYIFLLAIGWCLGMAELSHRLGYHRKPGLSSAAIITFLASSYIVVLNYLAPIAISDKLKGY
jgi:ABC-type molybdate transport system substrate-binding protein